MRIIVNLQPLDRKHVGTIKFGSSHEQGSSLDY